MKRIISLLLVLTFICLPFAGCGEKKKSNKKEITLMIYMIGSDLEAKAGAGTSDLEEIEKSGVDLSKTNVVVYAGGSPKWRNDKVDQEDGQTVLNLTKKGFKAVKTEKAVSMGEADTLAQFLNYAKKTYPAKEYALILWDHGNGPLIGYGKDMLYDNDSLTLGEMQQALESTDFKGKNKLAWVGFDACLMSSAELVCVMKAHADYLIASQEIEPSFGWNYAFMKKLGKVKTKALVKDLTNQYLTACEEYFERKGYEDREATLACIDLSKAGKLEKAINALFAKADSNIEAQYNQISVSRVNTRAFGRASTGSEYDLIDLNDLAVQMESLYPDEAKALQSAIKDAIVVNKTNAEKSCGLSLYYPFYNKSYYEDPWGDVYAKLGVLADYSSFLNSYAERWLGNDQLQNVAASMTPSAGNNLYTLELTEEQAASYTEASYYIMMQEGDGLYKKVYSSGDVTKSGNTLTANFDGQVLYAKNKYGHYGLLATEEHDRIGDVSRYSVYANFLNDPDMLITDYPDGFEQKVEGHRFQIAANNKTKEIKTSAIVPWNANVTADTLLGGKVEDADLSQWTKCLFLDEDHSYLTRDENGVIKALSEWTHSGYLSGYQFHFGDDIQFTFGPLAAFQGNYCLMFEIGDSQGNRYCSEPIPVTDLGDLEDTDTYTPERTDITWNDGDELKLAEEGNVTFYLTTVDYLGNTRYTLKAENNNDFDVTVSGEYLGYDDIYYCDTGHLGYFVVPAGETAAYEYGIAFGTAAEYGLIGKLNSLHFGVTVRQSSGKGTVVYGHEFNVTLTEKTAITPASETLFGEVYKYDSAVRSIMAKEQVLFQQDGITVKLLGLGGDSADQIPLRTLLCLENNGDTQKTVRIDGMVFDRTFVDCATGPITIPAGCILYRSIQLFEDDLELYNIQSPASAALCISTMQWATLEGGGGYAKTYTCPIQLSARGSGSPLTEAGRVLYNENGIKIILEKEVAPSYDGGTYEWQCVLINNRDTGVNVTTGAAKYNGKEYAEVMILDGVFSSGGKCYPNQVTRFIVNAYDYEASTPIEIELIIKDFQSESVLWKTEMIPFNNK